MYKIKFFITTGTIQAQGNQVDVFANEDFPLLKQLVSLLENHMKEDTFILNTDNETVQNDT